jgi:hypothetical protein
MAIAAATTNFDLVDIATFVTLDIGYLLRLFAAGAATAHPIRSTNGRVIPGVAKVGASLSDNFLITSGNKSLSFRIYLIRAAQPVGQRSAALTRIYLESLMSVLGQQQTLRLIRPMSALPPKAGIAGEGVRGIAMP